MRCQKLTLLDKHISRQPLLCLLKYQKYALKTVGNISGTGFISIHQGGDIKQMCGLSADFSWCHKWLCCFGAIRSDWRIPYEIGQAIAMAIRHAFPPAPDLR
jgi:hypothetical protein